MEDKAKAKFLKISLLLSFLLLLGIGYNVSTYLIDSQISLQWMALKKEQEEGAKSSDYNFDLPCPSSKGQQGLSTTFTKIAMVVSLTTKMGDGYMKFSMDNNDPSTLVFFKNLLPSFCRTASPGYLYTFYIIYDYDDQKFTFDVKYRSKFSQAFQKAVADNCNKDIEVHVVYSKAYQTGLVARTQNDGVMIAHKSGEDYFYRTNDDAIMLTPGWTDIFIQTLSSLTPPNLGVVGPQHTQGNEEIIVFDFTHRTHVDVFGFHYPHFYENWFADEWITKVYAPERSVKIMEVNVDHDIGSQGTRYTVGEVDNTQSDRIYQIMADGQKYVAYKLKKCYGL